MEITIKSPKTGTPDPENEGKLIPRTVTVAYNFGSDGVEDDTGKTQLSNAVESFGANVVFSKFQAQCATDLGNSCRRILNEPESTEQSCLDFVTRYKPGEVTKGGARRIAKTLPQLVEELKNPDTTQERKLAIKDLLKSLLDKHAEENKLATQALKAG